ncbi:hypothetical protein SODALDRAFT_322813 [Sodiomyces alkalinus F11]|uniref:M protein, serotype 2.1 n=1 Tax=Sodiomyces alkalinus (strain CBS 110278 / VKM F-3762 / F11) TaxID=1314773 RepID=A0A3N2Q4P0_SODAK|nr:hypothetical protein SODALDRAFT_322813 [Sodiomyces alkalinus F11]ROT41740.1 hypothetical protein SODALDRAFT_322813 [Sodiomyces alkalinus F11]
MSAATKKPPAATGGRTSLEPGSSPSPTPSRPLHRHSASVSSPGALARSRSLRTGTPVSARAAAAATAGRRESMLGSNSTSSSLPSPDFDEDTRAALVAQLDDVKDRLSKAELASEQYRRQAEVLQSRFDDAREESAKLEEKVHEHEELIETLRNEKREISRQVREMEAIYEAERSAMTREKEDMANREEEMQMVIQRLKDSLAQKANSDEEGRPSRQTQSPSVDGGFAPPSSLHRSDSRSSSKLVLQKDKLIESLRLELAEAQIKLVEAQNSGGGRVHEVEKQLMEARMANARLMEDNESYQLLLQEKTLNGDFSKNDFSYMGSAAANQDALNALEGRQGGTSLADELSDSEAADNTNNEEYRRLETELKTAKDQNKALTLYINKIIERLLQHQDFEHILDQTADVKPAAPANTNKDLPPPPSEKPSAAGPSVLQRVKSIAIGTGKPRPRPMSINPTAAAPSSSAHEDPDTAPRIPIGNLTRNTSTRRASRPMSEQFGPVAASLVNQMYRGPLESPTSPTLGTPRHSQTFFMGASASANPRQSIGSTVGTPHHHQSTGNYPGMRSETSSTSGDSASVVGAGDASTPPPQVSPPRSHHDKQTTLAGNKPRPLRLVQEAETKTEPANKRSSWMGWASGWAAQKKEPEAGTSGVGQALPE